MLLPALAVMGMVAAVHAGPAHWIQGCYYLASALPLAMALAGLRHARRTGNPSARLRGAVFLATFFVFAAHSWRRVEHHELLIAEHETTLTPTLAALAAYLAANGSYPEELSAVRVDAPPAPAHLGERDLGRVDYVRTANGYQVVFRHSIFRAHVYEPEAGWYDEVRRGPVKP